MLEHGHDKKLHEQLASIQAFMGQKPAVAESSLREILGDKLGTDGPQKNDIILMLAIALRLQNRSSESLPLLTDILEKMPSYAAAYQEIGLVEQARGNKNKAIEALEKSIALDPALAIAWKNLATLYADQGDESQAQAAFKKYIIHSQEHPELVQAAEHIFEGRLGLAEPICRVFLKKDPHNVSAIRMLADIGLQVGQYEGAENLLIRCLELAPDFYLARLNYVTVLDKLNKHEQALVEINTMLQVQAKDPQVLSLKANILVQIGQFDEALAIYEFILDNFPSHGAIQLNYGHTLKTVGRHDDAVKAYRASIKARAQAGVAYWSLANLKTFRFSPDEIKTMQEGVAVQKMEATEYFHLCFSLGKALEDAEKYEDSFKAYYKGNFVRRKTVHYDAQKNLQNASRNIKLYSPAYLKSIEGKGHEARDPIFIVGLPRSGSTLLEQILSSHSMVEGTMELPDIISIAHRMNDVEGPDEIGKYPEILSTLTPSALKELGQEYLDRTKIHRTDKPFFIDKMPNNFAHTGLIHSILPNAKIIDARRHPMDCCFSGFKQLFANGQNFTYNLEEIAKYYKNYVELMDHFDTVLPGRVLRVHYEHVVSDTENQIRRILKYCQLPFEDQCLRFYETERAVKTASSEQVRKPIYKSAVQHWRHYEEYLSPLVAILGDIVSEYPNVHE